MTDVANKAEVQNSDFIRLLRFKQWPKNLLVLAVPLAAGTVVGSEVGSALAGVILLLGTFIAWCLTSSAVYILNDAADAESDRLHPHKRLRPIASGAVTKPEAYKMSAMLGLLGCGLAVAVSLQLLYVLVAYASITIAYSQRLKRVAVVELGLVASGFPLRAMSGGLVLGLTVSTWFLMFVCACALTVVSSKRLSEINRLDAEASHHRAVLGEYTKSFLSQVQTIAVAFALGVYALWAITEASMVAETQGLVQLSMLPVAGVLFRFLLLSNTGLVDSPESLVFEDRPTQLLGFTWVAMFALGVVGL